MVKWTSQEKEDLRRLWPMASKEELLQYFNRTFKALEKKAWELHLCRAVDGPSQWTDLENKVLFEKYQAASWDDLLLSLPDRSKDAIVIQANKIGCARMCFWSKEEDDLLSLLWGRKKYSDIYEQFPNRTSGAVKARASFLNLSDMDWYRTNMSEINHWFFHKPNILNSYWAGFIAADGNIYNTSIKIELQESDADHLKKLQENVGHSGQLNYGLSSGSGIAGQHPFVKLVMNSTQMIEDLYTNFNLTARKTLTLSPPVDLPEVCIKAFIVGFIDGDGSLTSHVATRSNGAIVNYPVMYALGTKQMIDWVDVNTPGGHVVKASGNHLYKKVWYGTNAETIRNILSDLDIPYLKRKWTKWEKTSNIVLRCSS